ncbi:hypothetical protein [Haladaptatus halobius]|uniref:hypothetical protein n=1 Tax=Haladaptatus halobius TaxID=2884875 RepID=UPI001D0A2A63|nr:hypothetical protein [Haladaptatus halobius]
MARHPAGEVVQPVGHPLAVEVGFEVERPVGGDSSALEDELGLAEVFEREGVIVVGTPLAVGARFAPVGHSSDRKPGVHYATGNPQYRRR